MNILIKPNKSLLVLGIIFSIFMLGLTIIMISLQAFEVALVCFVGILVSGVLIYIYQASYVSINDSTLTIKIPFKKHQTIELSTIKDILCVSINHLNRLY